MELRPLSREQVSRVIHGRGNAPRVPVALHFWTHADAFPDPAAVRRIIDPYPEDVQFVPAVIPGVEVVDEDYPEYCWTGEKKTFSPTAALDERVVLEDWSTLDEVLARFPDPDRYPPLLKHDRPEDGRYRVVYWWYFFFERHWQLRGMTNALTDFYEYPDEVHRLYGALADFYIKLIRRAARESRFDGVFTSDDLGTQQSTFFSRSILKEFFLPCYRKVIAAAHEAGMDFWLHACGCIRDFIPDLIDSGVDVLHPIQKYTMEEREIARLFGDKLAIWAGMDVQRTIPFGTPEEVRREVRFLFDAYARPDGRFLFTAGNGVNGDCPLESLKALYEEAYSLTF